MEIWLTQSNDHLSEEVDLCVGWLIEHHIIITIIIIIRIIAAALFSADAVKVAQECQLDGEFLVLLLEDLY